MTILVPDRRKPMYVLILFICLVIFVRNNWDVLPGNPSPIQRVASRADADDMMVDLDIQPILQHEQVPKGDDIFEEVSKMTTPIYESESSQPATTPDGGELANSTVPWSSPVCRWQTRRDRLRQACSEGGWNDEIIDWTEMAGHYIIVDEKHKVLYCMIPKTASHSFRYLFGNLAIGKLESDMLYPIRNYLRQTGFKLLHDFRHAEDRERILREYFKMMVVRHPFDRLRSTFQNKMIAPGGLNYQVLFRSIDVVTNYLVRRGRLENGTIFDPYKHNISFRDFLYLVANKWDDTFMDEHWKPFDRHCRPCVIQYDYIFHMETVQDDVDILYDYLAAMEPHVVRELSQENVDTYVLSLEEKLRMTTDAFKDVREDVIEGLLKFYQKDFAMFGYEWKRETGAACEISSSDGSKSCC